MTNNKENTKEQALSERGSNRSQRPRSENFKKFIGSNWGPRPEGLPQRAISADFAAVRRDKLSQHFKGDCLIIPAGPLKVRNNDCDYRFRPHSAFAHMTGMGTDQEPDAVLVLHPLGDGGVARFGSDDKEGLAYTLSSKHVNHEAVLYFRPRASRQSEEFYADSRYGELWVGVRASIPEIESQTGIRCANIDLLEDRLKAECEDNVIRLVADSDPNVTKLVNDIRFNCDEYSQSCFDDNFEYLDSELAEQLSTLRLCKDSYELEQMQLAVDTTKKGFEEIIRSLPRATKHWRGERVVEGAFAAVSREEGNGVGYDTIVACGDHANTLHWICNDGPVREGEMILVDAGVEVDSLYTADITRTLPVNGKFSDIQREIYQAVLDVADAAFEKANEEGVRFKDMHLTALSVLASRLEKWGFLPVSAKESLDPDGQYHCRWMVHGTSHHLGIDVHDCALARKEMYLDAKLEPGMCFTIEPGLYFRADDLTVPEEYRGNAVRIEDDLYIDENGKCVRMSDHIPRTIDDVESWIQDLWAK